MNPHHALAGGFTTASPGVADNRRSRRDRLEQLQAEAHRLVTVLEDLETRISEASRVAAAAREQALPVELRLAAVRAHNCRLRERIERANRSGPRGEGHPLRFLTPLGKRLRQVLVWARAAFVALARRWPRVQVPFRTYDGQQARGVPNDEVELALAHQEARLEALRLELAARQNFLQWVLSAHSATTGAAAERALEDELRVRPQLEQDLIDACADLIARRWRTPAEGDGAGSFQ